MNHAATFQHPQFSRRQAVQAGAIGLLGLGANHLEPLRAMAAPQQEVKAKSVIFIFLSGGLAQQDSFDMKPRAPDEIRGEFNPIATATPGIHICEHLPELAKRSDKWSLVRSLTHPYNEHSQGHMVMLAGRTPMPPGFDASKPKPTDWPSIASIAGGATLPRTNLPPAIILPEKLIHRTGRVIPGQFAGQMGPRRDAHLITAARFNATSYGAWPEFGFHHERGGENPDGFAFQAPNLAVPEGFDKRRFNERLGLLKEIERQQRALAQLAETEPLDRNRQTAVSLLSGGKLQHVFDVVNAEPKVLDRYGRNVFGWSLLMARRMVEAGVNLVQVNLGNNETWDTHQAAFPNLKNFLFPPTDLAVSALLDDLADRGLLDQTLVVMAGEFGRTPKVFSLPKARLPGRDHWGAVQTVWLAGGGVRGGTVVGSSDNHGGHPASDPQKPENLAATIYEALGIPKQAVWYDAQERPMPIYHGEPVPGLS
ncbi:MAG: DUF1501 domain-containing protein [Planctomycetota bacterium]|nr:DUF1501 domain-containing protein [Planctomycetota bacterium]